MSDIYINQETGKKIRVYEEIWVHVYDDDDDNLNFWDTAKGVAEWCMEAVEDDYTPIEEGDECEYCGGNCPHDVDNACDGYLGDIEDLYANQRNYNDIKEAYDDEDWIEVINLSGCRYCEWTTEERWVVEEIEGENNA
jgi:hypothetical protein